MNIVFHIGYHKTATSWLQRAYFPGNPQILALCDSDEPYRDALLHYLVRTPDGKFSADTLRDIFETQLARSVDAARHKAVVVSAERLSGHPVSGGFDSHRTAQRICEAFPEARILMVVREQLEMMKSVYKQLLKEGYIGSPAQLIATESWKTSGFQRSYFEYDLLFSKYLSLFGNSQVQILPYDLMRRDKSQFIQSLCHFMGVDVVEIPQSEKRVNDSLPNNSLGIMRTMNYFRRSELNPFPLIPLPDRLRTLVVEYILKGARRLQSTNPIFSEEEARNLREYYSESNRRLHSLCDVELGPKGEG